MFRPPIPSYVEVVPQLQSYELRSRWSLSVIADNSVAFVSQLRNEIRETSIKENSIPFGIVDSIQDVGASRSVMVATRIQVILLLFIQAGSNPTLRAIISLHVKFVKETNMML